MLVTPANPCPILAGIFNSRRRASRTMSQCITNSNNNNGALFTVSPALLRCGARRRVRDDGGGNEDQDETYGYNEEIAMLEIYSQSRREEALIVTAIVDEEEEEEEVEVVIFKGYSSCLSGETAVDPARSVLPERAVIKHIDIVKGPFDPSHIHYFQKGISFVTFKDSIIKLIK
ncbi:unnamed protein product [Cochlearia groenlandica]